MGVFCVVLVDFSALKSAQTMKRRNDDAQIGSFRPNIRPINWIFEISVDVELFLTPTTFWLRGFPSPPSLGHGLSSSTRQ